MIVLLDFIETLWKAAELGRFCNYKGIIEVVLCTKLQNMVLQITNNDFYKVWVEKHDL